MANQSAVIEGPESIREVNRFDSGILQRIKTLPFGRALLVFTFIFYTYLMHSKAIDQFYIGHCHDLEERLFRRNNSG